ncbi:MAG TPA: L-dopachrome tautomerase-related protein [Herpetosiphonaceae bacterium]
MKLFRRIVLRGAAVLSLIIVIALGYVKITRGSGATYPNLNTAPLFGPHAVSIAAELPLPPGNVAVAADGRIFFNYHYLGGKDRAGNSVFELINGTPVPYPNTAFQPNFNTTLGMVIDAQNRLWTIDPGGVDGARNTRLLAFDLATNEIAYDYTFLSDDADFAQDLQVSSDGRTVYAASTGVFGFVPANLIVLDTASGVAQIRLKGDASVEPQPWRIHTQQGDGVTTFFGLIDWQAGVDGLALTHDDTWLYFGGISHDTLYRIRTSDLRNAQLSDTDLAMRIEPVAKKPLSDGFKADAQGNVYLTDIEHGSIVRVSPEGTLVTLVQDPRVRWADGLSFGPDNTIYFSDSAIPAYLTNTAQPSGPEVHATEGPYYLFKFTNDLAGAPAR